MPSLSGYLPRSLQATLPSQAPGAPGTRKENRYERKFAVSLRKRKQREGLDRPAALDPAPCPEAAAILVRAGLFPASSAGRQGPRRRGGCRGNGSILGWGDFW